LAACGGAVGPSLTNRRAGCIGARDSAACLIAPHIELSRSRTIQQSRDQLAAKGSVKEAAEGFVIEAELEGASARDLNRALSDAWVDSKEDDELFQSVVHLSCVADNRC
jgi:hypothetical protein